MLPLTEDTLRAAYDYLTTTPPFSGWNLPEGNDVTFKVTKTKTKQGTYQYDGKHIISVSTGLIGRTTSLMELMAHEMIHLHLNQVNMDKGGEHSKAFHKYAAQVCKIHGFDEKLF